MLILYIQQVFFVIYFNVRYVYLEFYVKRRKCTKNICMIFFFKILNEGSSLFLVPFLLKNTKRYVFTFEMCKSIVDSYEDNL